MMLFSLSWSDPTATDVFLTAAAVTTGVWSLACYWSWWQLTKLEALYLHGCMVDDADDDDDASEEEEELHWTTACDSWTQRLKNALLTHALVVASGAPNNSVNSNTSTYANACFAREPRITFDTHAQALAFFEEFVRACPPARQGLMTRRRRRNGAHRWISSSSSSSSESSSEL